MKHNYWGKSKGFCPFFNNYFFHLKILTMKRLMFFTTCFWLIVASSCHKKEENPTISFPIEFQYNILDANNQVSTNLKAGENFKIRFLMINKSDTAWSLSVESLDGIDSFFQINNVHSNINLGRPFVSTFCNDINPVIRSKDTLKVEIPWISDPAKRYPYLCGIKKDQKNLEKGSYFSSFSTTFNFTKGFTFENASIKKHFKIDFLIN
jgi:hypothetical protein